MKNESWNEELKKLILNCFQELMDFVESETFTHFWQKWKCVSEENRELFLQQQLNPAGNIGGSFLELHPTLSATFLCDEGPPGGLLRITKHLDHPNIHKINFTFPSPDNDLQPPSLPGNELAITFNSPLHPLQIDKSYNRFIPPELIKVLGRKNLLDVQLGDQVEKNVTVLFSDIRAYTSLSETMTIQENFKFLNAYISRVVPVMKKYNGLIHQFLGDGIMALFLNDTDDAVQAALAYQKMVSKYNSERLAIGRAPLTIGIGLHTGSLMIGIIGDQNRMGTAVVSDTVNTASRMEGLTKHFQASILVSEHTLRSLVQPHNFNYRCLGKVQVKGKTNAFSIYEIFDDAGSGDISPKIRTKAVFEEGISAYFSKQFDLAMRAFRTVIQQDPTDHAARLYYNKALVLIKDGSENNWPGIEIMLNK